MAEQTRKINPILRYGFIIVVVAGAFLMNNIQGKKAANHTGTLEYRMVTGVRDGQFQVILLETADRYVILDSAFQNALVTEDGELISRPKQLLLLQKYQSVDYRVGFHEQSADMRKVYMVTRELFNEMRFGQPIGFVVDKKKHDLLLSLNPVK
jgi:hypothetical protein